MARNGRIVLLIVLIGVLIVAIFVMRQRIFSKPETAQLKVSAAILSDPRQCQITVTVDRPQNDVDISVAVTAKTGIRFADTGQNSASRDVGRVFPREERILTFDCYLDGTILHSGTYIVKAVAKHLSPGAVEGDQYATGNTKLYVELRPDNTNSFLASEDAFDELFTGPYVEGAYYQYSLGLQPEDNKPSGGLLHVRVNSSKDDFSPALDVVVSGGVAFLSPSFTGFIWHVDDALVRIQTEVIDSGGSRIVTVPFSMIPAAMPGSYGIKVLQAGRGQSPGEMAPLYVGVTSSPETPGQKWLVRDKRDDAPILTPAPTRQ